MNKVITILSSVILLFIFSCKKESFITSKDARLNLSVDSLKFDTVFTTTGSVTQFFKIKNDNNQKLHVDRVTLKGGTASFFKINVDGFVGPDVKDIDIEANDSIYVFVSVSINQNADQIPFIISDSIQVVYNGNDRFVQLEAWGQNAFGVGPLQNPECQSFHCSRGTPVFVVHRSSSDACGSRDICGEWPFEIP